MSVGKQYVLDANVFIQAHQKYYAFDLCPGFWMALVRKHEVRRVCSIDKIKSELIDLNDHLTKWVKDKVPESFFKGTADRAVTEIFRDVVNWVQNEPQFKSEAKAEFSSKADGWIVAYAKANGLVVVTHEVFAPDAKKKVKIPNVCVEFDVDYCETFEMLRELDIRFVLKKRR